MSITVSVIIPTHNRGNMIKHAIDSVLKQTLSDFEIIIVSDGSIDNTDAIVESYQIRDERIKYIKYAPAKGGNYARNEGIKVAQGRYIAFLDDDDEWVTSKLEKQIKVFSKDSKIGLVYTGINIIYKDYDITYTSNPKIKGDLKDKIYEQNYIGTTSSVMIKKEVLERVGGFDEKLGALQDYDLWIRCCEVCLVGNVEENLVNYYNELNHRQISSDVNKYENAIEYINQKYKNRIDEVDSIIKKNRKYHNQKLLINKALRNNNSRLARVYMKKNFKISLLPMFFLSFIPYRYSLKIKQLVN